MEDWIKWKNLEHLILFNASLTLGLKRLSSYTSRDVTATLDNVWNVISDIDREPEFWHGTKSIKNISKTGNTIEREVVIAFRNSKYRRDCQAR